MSALTFNQAKEYLSRCHLVIYENTNPKLVYVWRVNKVDPFRRDHEFDPPSIYTEPDAIGTVDDGGLHTVKFGYSGGNTKFRGSEAATLTTYCKTKQEVRLNQK